MNKCKHEWIEDELFKSGAVTMFFGKLNNIKKESKYICKNCSEIKFMEKRNE